ncbi:hypothetical protein SAMN04487906_1938 [Zhouia amylolytica]|uniref:Uncharacterized protein n=2 Tax=Zhouia amylolytica TaxID=376730 RepID=A0A1I6TA62_9FLAO|nr:hypothetical protein [Zhouia amylolytica]SFS86105.1 hypothetical protein SAMN04487906_1938 [Zhouia amylolytica]
MEHRFYSKSKNKQNQIQLFIALGALTVIMILCYLSWATGIYLIGLFTFPMVLTIIAPFFDVPSLKENGKLTYHSNLFLSEKPTSGVIKIHGGTLFDYVFVIDNNMSGRQRTNYIIHQYLEGILDLIDRYDEFKEKDLKIRGTSYIINERTGRRIGFNTIETDNIQKIILIFNYFNVMLTYCIAKGTLSFPNLNQTRTFETSLSRLVAHREHINDLNKKFKKISTRSFMK